MPITSDELDALLEGMEPVIARVRDLETRLAAVETKSAKGIDYRGVHRIGTAYERGAFVTCKGSLWFCTGAGQDEVPGNGPGWQLCVKGAR